MLCYDVPPGHQDAKSSNGDPAGMRLFGTGDRRSNFSTEVVYLNDFSLAYEEVCLQGLFGVTVINK